MVDLVNSYLLRKKSYGQKFARKTVFQGKEVTEFFRLYFEVHIKIAISDDSIENYPSENKQ